jgi:pimeloyl-ACP methyl ester carboxylesterase
MSSTTSADGTTISYDRAGNGPVIVFVSGAFNLRDTCAPLAGELASDHTVITYDRRGRGQSTDTSPYAIEREVDDLRALLKVAGGSASVFGYSSGATLALKAVADGLQVDRLFLHEPPFRFDDSQPAPPADLPARLQALLEEDRPGDVVATFQIEGIGLPEEMVRNLRQSPMWPHLEALAQSVVYDATITGTLQTPTPEMAAVPIPTLILQGERTWPFLQAAATHLSDRLPNATLTVLAGAGHDIDAVSTAAAIRDFER